MDCVTKKTMKKKIIKNIPFSPSLLHTLINWRKIPSPQFFVFFYFYKIKKPLKKELISEHRKKSSFFLYMIIFGFEEKLKIGRFFSSPSKIFSQEKKSKNPKKICDKKNENFFFCFCFSVFSPLFFSYYKKIFLYFFPLFHFWNVCVISSCFNRTWLEFVSIRLEQFFRVIKKILKGKKRRQKHFSSLCQYPPWKKKLYPARLLLYI